MRLLLLGSAPGPDDGQQEMLRTFCGRLGGVLAASAHQILLCSCQPGSADRATLEGVAGTPNKHGEFSVIVHRPDDAELRQQWQSLFSELGITPSKCHDHRGPDFRDWPGGHVDADSLGMAFLHCQLRALADADVVLAVGGRRGGTAALALSIACDRPAAILPYRFLDGAAEQTYLRLEERLKNRLSGEDIDRLSNPTQGATAALDLINKVAHARTSSPPRVFLSYPWKRPDHADMVEAVLRRHQGVTVFRDEHDIRAGESISDRLLDEIQNRCDLFLALWSREYVESPYCHDEVHLWRTHRGRERLFLLRFDETRPVWYPLREHPENRESFAGSWPLVQLDRRLVEAAVGDLLTDFEERGVVSL